MLNLKVFNPDESSQERSPEAAQAHALAARLPASVSVEALEAMAECLAWLETCENDQE